MSSINREGVSVVSSSGSVFIERLRGEEEGEWKKSQGSSEPGNSTEGFTRGTLVGQKNGKVKIVVIVNLKTVSLV